MKNKIKLFGSLNRTRSAKVPLLIIALAAVIGLSFAACGGGDDGGSNEKVVFTMKFDEHVWEDEDGNIFGGWLDNDDWGRWIYEYHDENNLFDLADMYTHNKVYIFSYSFRSDIDIDYLGAMFFNFGDPDWKWIMISDYANIKSDIKKNTRYSGKIVFVPNNDAAGCLPEITSLEFDIGNRSVSTPPTLSFYQFSFEKVDKENGLDKWAVSGRDFSIDNGTFAKTETSFEGKSDVLYVRPAYNSGAYDWSVINYDLSGYAGKTIEIIMSMDVYLKKPARSAWQINSSDPFCPVICGAVAPDNRFPPYHSGPALSANRWYTISGSNIITVPGSGDTGKTLYLSGQQIDGTEAYFANAKFIINESSGGSNTPIILTDVTTNGSSSQTTTQLTLTFSGTITDLTADNIILNGVAGVTKGELTGTGPTYTLNVSGFTGGGNLMVWVSKLGYTITNSSKTVPLYYNSSGGNITMNGTWSRTNGGYTYSILISGNNWTFSENNTGIFKGTWNSNVTPAAPSGGNLILKTTHQNSSGGWVSIPSGYESMATNTASFSINSAGTQMTITNSASTNAEFWGKTEGTYTKGGSTGGGGNGEPTAWTAVADSKFDTTHIFNIAWGNNKFVAVGKFGKMAYSSDGINWTAVADSKFGSTDDIDGIVWGNNKFFAGGWGNYISYSSDGIIWSQTAALPGSYSSSVNGIAWGNNKFVAVGSQSKIMHSPDGINWTAVANSTFSNSVNCVAWGNNKFVAGGNNGAMAYSSSDGTTWTAVANSTFDNSGGGTIYNIAFGNNKFVAVGMSGKMAYSSDGINWMAVGDSKFGASTIQSITWGNNKFVAVGGNGKIAYSSDGINWTAVADSKFGSSSQIRGIAWGNNKFVVVGIDGKMAYSSGN